MKESTLAESNSLERLRGDFMETREHIVDFANYCLTCKNRAVNSVDEPCNDCLANPTNTDSTRPVNWQPAN